MRILLVGQAAFAEQVLTGLAGAGHDVVAVVCPPDRGPKPDPVKTAALGRGIQVHQFPSLKRPEARDAFEGARADLALLAYVTQIVPEALLGVPRLGNDQLRVERVGEPGDDFILHVEKVRHRLVKTVRPKMIAAFGVDQPCR